MINSQYALTTIEVQGQQESVYEIYADNSREQTIAYALEEEVANLIAAAPELLEALKVSLDMLNQLLEAAKQGIVPDISIGFFKNRTEILEPAIAKAEGN